MKTIHRNSRLGMTSIVRRGATLLAVGALAMAISGQDAHAGVIFSNFGAGSSYDITTGNTVGNGFDGNAYTEGDTFTPLTTSAFGSLSVALSCVFTCPNAFSVSLDSDSSGQPGVIIESFSVSGSVLGTLGSNNAPLLLTSTLHPTLSSGTHYWIVVSSDINDSIAWNLNNTGDSSNEAISADAGASWFAPSGLTPGAYEVDSQVSTTTPEPATTALLAGGGLLLWLGRKRSSLPR